MTDREALTDSSNYAQYLTLVHSDSFDKDEAADKETLNTEQANPLANGDGASDVDREALNEELEKIDAEIKTLKTVLASKQKRAADIRKTLGSTIVTDMKDKVKTIQESDVIMRTNQAFKSAGEKTSAAFSNFGKKMVDVNSKLRESIGTSFNNVKKSKSLFALPSAQSTESLTGGSGEQWEQI